MSRRNVYHGEMSSLRYQDRDVEALFRGETPEDQGLARLAPVLDAMRRRWGRAPSEDEVARFAAMAAAEARAATAHLEPTAPDRVAAWSLGGVARRQLAGAAAAVLILTSMTGVAAASNGAAPGDTLYGLDRALERLGVGAGGARERILEAQELLDEGQVTEAISHIAEALDSHDGEITSPEVSGASQALLGAAERIGAEGQGAASSEVRQAVSAMLAEMALLMDSGELTGAEFAKQISELASLIGGRPDDAGPEETPGNSQGGGKPEQPGGQGNGSQGPGDNPGRGGSGNPGRP